MKRNIIFFSCLLLTSCECKMDLFCYKKDTRPEPSGYGYLDSMKAVMKSPMLARDLTDEELDSAPDLPGCGS